MELYGCDPTPGNKTTVDVFLLLFLHNQTEIVIKKGKNYGKLISKPIRPFVIYASVNDGRIRFLAV